MILQSLNALFDRLVGDEAYELATPGFSPQKISFYLILNPDGSMEVNDARVPAEKGKLLPRRLKVPGDAKPPGAGINPGFLWDNQIYLLGRQPADKPAGFGQKRFEAFRQRHLDAETEIGTPEFSAVCRFLESWSPERLAEHRLLDEVGTGFGVFKLAGEPHSVHTIPTILNWWTNRLPTGADSVQGQCLLTGDVLPIARLHPKIKGVLGAQAAGASMVSFNSSSYESYGKEQSYNSPVSETAAFRYGAALNALLSGPQSPKHRIRIGDSTCVFWTEKPTVFEDVFAGISTGGNHALEETQDSRLRLKMAAFLNALQKGREADGDLADDPDHTRFFLLGLAPNAARLSVRFFYQSTIRELLDHLRRHKHDLEIVREFEHPVGKRHADSEFPAYWEFLRETVRQGDDPSPLLGGAFMRAILEGIPYPALLLGATVRRVQIERTVNYLRAAAIKAVLSRNHHLALTPMLDPDNHQPAYLRGRLFAVLQKIQEEGYYEQTGRPLEKTIRDIYFAAASATPGSVFPRIQTLSTHHRRHLKFGRKIWFDQLLSDIEWPLAPGEAVKPHTLEEQGLFILGYYHQRKVLFTRKEAAPEDAEPAVAETAV